MFSTATTSKLILSGLILVSDDLRHSFLFSTGWTSSGELKVVEELEFSKGWIVVNSLCRLGETGLSAADERIMKKDRPSGVVKRAWTWSPFHD